MIYRLAIPFRVDIWASHVVAGMVASIYILFIYIAEGAYRVFENETPKNKRDAREVLKKTSAGEIIQNTCNE